jgi:chromosome segregation ATPase
VKRLFPAAAVFLAGLIVGAGALRVFEWVTVDAALNQQKTELTRLRTDLRNQQKELATGQQRLGAQAAEFQKRVASATQQAEQVLAAQGSAVERLKKVIAVLRQLRDGLNSN